MVDVVALIIRRNSEILVERRKKDRRVDPDRIVIPGGHVEESESLVQACKRELREELDLECNDFRFVMTASHDTVSEKQTVHYYSCENWKGVPKNREAEAIFWTCAENLECLDFEIDKRAVRQSSSQTNQVDSVRCGGDYMPRDRISSDTLAKIKNRLREAGISWAIFAGAAASCYGSKREITDIDILLKCEDLEKAKTVLKGVSMEGVDFGCGAEIDTPQGKCSFYLDDKMIERLEWKQLFGVLVPVMSVEDNIVLKAILQRGKEKGKHDFEDIETMVSHQKIDLEYLAERVRMCHAERRVNPLLRSVVTGL